MRGEVVNAEKTSGLVMGQSGITAIFIHELGHFPKPLSGKLVRISAQRLGMRVSGLKKAPLGTVPLKPGCGSRGEVLWLGRGTLRAYPWLALRNSGPSWLLGRLLSDSVNGLGTGQSPEVSSVASQGSILSR